MTETMRRISLLIREDQFEKLQELELNVSGLIRDLIDDRLSASKITLSVREDTRKLYDQVVSNTGSTDGDFEEFLRAALRQMLKTKIKDMKKLEQQLERKG